MRRGRPERGKMSKLIYVLIVVVVGGFGGIVIYLASQDMPPPTERIEKVIPKSRYSGK